MVSRWFRVTAHSITLRLVGCSSSIGTCPVSMPLGRVWDLIRIVSNRSHLRFYFLKSFLLPEAIHPRIEGRGELGTHESEQRISGNKPPVLTLLFCDYIDAGMQLYWAFQVNALKPERRLRIIGEHNSACETNSRTHLSSDRKRADSTVGIRCVSATITVLC